MIQAQQLEEGGVRILHVGNVFLDRPIAPLTRDTSEHRRKELRDSFCRFLQTVKEKDVRLVLISGNLLDNEFASNDTVVFLMRELGECPDCHFVIAPGPRDHYFDGSIYKSGRLPRNVHIFTEEILSRFDFDELGVTVYGWAFMGHEHMFSPLAHKRVVRSDRLNLICGYGCVDAEDQTQCPIKASEITAFGAHYAALSSGEQGHSGFMRFDGTVLSYSGHFESVSFADKEEGGANLVTALPLGADAWQLLVKRVPTGVYRYAEEIIDVSHLSKESDVAPLICERIAKEGYGEKTALRVRLRGSVTPEAAFLSLGDAADYGVYAFEVVDETVPTDGTEMLLHEMSAKGELYRHLYRAMTEGTPESCARAARTFRVGYAALSGKDFTRH